MASWSILGPSMSGSTCLLCAAGDDLNSVVVRDCICLSSVESGLFQIPRFHSNGAGGEFLVLSVICEPQIYSCICFLPPNNVLPLSLLLFPWTQDSIAN